MSGVKFDIEKFDGKINFGLWQVQVKDVLIQSSLHKALKGKPVVDSSKDSKADSSKDSKADSSKDSSKSSMSDEDWEEMDLKCASAIRLCLAKNVLANVQGASTAKELWEKLEELYQAKGISNRLYLKEQFHTLRMSGGTTISDHLSILNGIVSELEAIGVKIDDEDIALRLIWSLPSSFEHMKPILMYGKEMVNFAEVTGKLLSEERRLKNGGHNLSENSALVATSGNNKNSNKKKGVCWKCGQHGHLKRNCPKGGADSMSYSKSEGETNIVSLSGDSDYVL